MPPLKLYPVMQEVQIPSDVKVAQLAGTAMQLP